MTLLLGCHCLVHVRRHSISDVLWSYIIFAIFFILQGYNFRRLFNKVDYQQAKIDSLEQLNACYRRDIVDSENRIEKLMEKLNDKIS